MKKLYLLLMSVLFTVMAQAWTVNFTNPDGWTKVYAYTFSPETNGGWPGKAMTQEGDVWTYTGTGTPGKIIFTNGSGSQTGNLDFVDGATYDKNGVVGAKLNTYKMSFSNTANWAEVYVYTFSPELCGSWPGKKLTKGEDGYYTLTLEATSEPEMGGIIFNGGNGKPQTPNLTFKVDAIVDANGNELGAQTTKYTMSLNNTAGWEKVFVYTFQPEAFGTWPGTELSKGEDGYYTMVYEATSEPSFGGVIFSNGDGLQTDDLSFQNGAVITNGETPIPPTPGEKNLYLVGELTGWEGPDEAYKFAQDGNVYTLSLDNGLTGTWKIYDGTWDYQFGAGDDNMLESGVEANAWFNGQNFNSAFSGKTTITFTLVDGSAVQGSSIPSKLTVTAEGVVEPLPTEEWYVSVQGPFNSWQGEGVHPNAKGDAEITVPGTVNPDGFKIKVWNGLGDTWYCNGSAIALDTPTVIEGNYDQPLMTIDGAEAANYYVVKFNVKSNELTITGDTSDSIEVIEASENTPVYFNLQGVKVANPENGIYVKVVNGVASKVVL